MLFEIEFDTHNFIARSRSSSEFLLAALCGLFPANGSTDFDGKHFTSSCPWSRVYYVSYSLKNRAHPITDRQDRQTIQSNQNWFCAFRHMVFFFHFSILFFFLYVSLYLYMMILCYSILKIEMYYCIE